MSAGCELCGAVPKKGEELHSVELHLLTCDGCEVKVTTWCCLTCVEGLKASATPRELLGCLAILKTLEDGDEAPKVFEARKVDGDKESASAR